MLGLNARGQDGRDPSWIWDVPFEVLAGRRAVCIGERAADLAVRLDYAGVDVAVAPSVRRAVALLDVPRRAGPAPHRRPDRQLQRVPAGARRAPGAAVSAGAAIGVGLVRPDLLGTYGDGGNAVVLVERLRRRAVPAELVPVHAGEAVPGSVKVLVLGGGEDAAQRALMRDTAVLASVASAAERGVPVLAVCAALQVLGRYFDDGDGRRTARRRPPRRRDRPAPPTCRRRDGDRARRVVAARRASTSAPRR